MDYQFFLQKAFRSVVKDILNTVANEGIELGYAYYLTFETDRNDVQLPDFVKAKYPKEITLVLENQFENLSVDDKSITVDLSFGGVFATVVIPFTALKRFADPNHQFVLTFLPERPQSNASQSMPQIICLDDLRKQS